MNSDDNKWSYWIIGIGAVTVLVVTLIFALIGSGNSSDARAASTTTPKPTTTTAVPATTAPRPALGVYAGPGSPAAVAKFSATVGAPATYALDYLDGSSWQTISNPDWVLSQWAGSSYHMVFAVPMLAPGSTLAQGAVGNFNASFHQLGTNLVSKGFSSAWLIIGSDPNSAASPWHVDSTATAAEYVTYWQKIVKAMRSVPGQSFQFVWDTTPPTNGLTPQDLYPGNASVNVIATDAFDADPTVPAAQRWPSLQSGPYGLDWFASFASRQGKPIMLAKWGLVPATIPGGSGDDPSLIRNLLAWSQTNKVAVIVTWDYGSWALTGGEFPQSLEALRTALKSGTT